MSLLFIAVIIYTVEVHTSDLSGADTTAAMFITLFGQQGDSGQRRLYVTQTDGKMFSQGKVILRIYDIWLAIKFSIF